MIVDLFDVIIPTEPLSGSMLIFKPNSRIYIEQMYDFHE